jgi:hypothetical protein
VSSWIAVAPPAASKTTVPVDAAPEQLPPALNGLVQLATLEIDTWPVEPLVTSTSMMVGELLLPPPELLFPELLLLPELLFPDGAWPFQAGL